MALKITDNFDHTSDQPNFKRDQFATIAEMKACTVCDDGHLSYCKENGKRYEFQSSNALDDTTGYWREFVAGGGGASDADDVTYDSTKETHTEGSAGAELAKLDEKVGPDSLTTTSQNLSGAVNELQKEIDDLPSEETRDAQYKTAEANRDTEYQSAEANRDSEFNQEIASLESQYVMQVATSYPETNIPADNTYYQLGSIESLTIGKITDDDDNPLITKGVIIEFDVPSTCTSFALAWSNTLYWANSKDASDTLSDGYPNIKPGYRYQILISYLNASLTLFGQFNPTNSNS